MDVGTVLLIVLVLACPLTMIWAMRRGRGKHGHGKSDPQPPVVAARDSRTEHDTPPLTPGVGIDRDVARDTLRTELK